MKWIGQHIWSFISRFRNKVYFEDLQGGTSTTVLVVEADGEIKTNSLGSGGGGGGDADRVRLPVRFDETNGVSKGDPVYIKSYHGSSGPVIVAKADASSSAHMPAFGLADADYSHNDDGYAISIGNLIDLDTSSYSIGDTLYVAVGGGLTNVKPVTEANLIQNVGTVARSNVNNGQVEVVATGRSNDVPNLNDGNIFIGNSSNQATQQSLSSAITDVGDITLGGDLAIADDGEVTSVGDITFRIDSDNNETLTNNFYWKRDLNSSLMSLDENGLLTLSGGYFGSPALTLSQTGNTTATSPPQISFSREVDADNHEIGALRFYAEDANNNPQEYAQIRATTLETSNGVERGKLSLRLAKGNLLVDGLVLRSGLGSNEVNVDLGSIGSDSVVSTLGYFKGKNKIHPPSATYGNELVSGDVIFVGSGTTTAGKVHYLNSSGSWSLADSSTSSTTATGLLAVALGSNPSSDGMLLRGYVRMGNLRTSEAQGAIMYLGTSGVLTPFAPTGSGHFVRVIGHHIYYNPTNDANPKVQLMFNPSNDWVERA